MLLCFGVPVLLGHAKIDHINQVVFTASANEEIVRFDISVYQISVMYTLHPSYLCVGAVSINATIVNEHYVVPSALLPWRPFWRKSVDCKHQTDLLNCDPADRYKARYAALPVQNSMLQVYPLIACLSLHNMMREQGEKRKLPTPARILYVLNSSRNCGASDLRGSNLMATDCEFSRLTPTQVMHEHTLHCCWWQMKVLYPHKWLQNCLRLFYGPL